MRVYAVTMRMMTAEAAMAAANVLKRLSPVNFTYRPALIAEIIEKKKVFGNGGSELHAAFNLSVGVVR
jgi:hypothetical protein